MNIPARLTFPLPGDAAFLGQTVRASDWPDAVDPRQQQAVQRAVQGLDLIALIGLAEGLPPERAAALYGIWLVAQGESPAACVVWFNLGVLHMKAGRPAEAILAYRRALQIKPDLTEASINLGTALESAGEVEAALATWRGALPSPANRKVLHNQLGRVLEGQGRLGAAAEELRASLLIDPDQPDVIQHLVHARQRMAAWPPQDLQLPGLDCAKAARHCGPLAALALFDDPVAQAATAAEWIARKVAAQGGPLAPPDGYRHDRLRIGFLSTDFCRHAMSFLIAALIETLDRQRFEVFAYDASPEDGSEIRARMRAAFDHFTIIKTLTDEAAARRIRADEIDILVDLNGLTKGARLEILRWKPAPVQVTYLGYIGPVPLPELDYLLCDDITIPKGQEAGYAPTPLRLAGCYQANDSRPPLLPQVSRQDEGLPEDAFVFTCVSHHYKVTAKMFGAWCRIVGRVPGSILWLIDDNPESRGALTDCWVSAGLEAERLIFAQRVDPDRYRARMALADLFLDTAPYNAGTIASDALRMGLPMITLQGRAFAGRMASSLLTAVGLPHSIATTLQGYEDLAVDLATNPTRLAQIRDHLQGGAWARTLGDDAGFARRFEAAMLSVWRRPERSVTG